MKKNTIFKRYKHTLKYIFLVGILCACMTACGNADKQNTQQAETIEEDNTQLAEDDESADPIYIIEPQLTQDDSYEMQDWQAAYAKFAEELEAEYQDMEWLDITYSFFMWMKMIFPGLL